MEPMQDVTADDVFVAGRAKATATVRLPELATVEDGTIYQDPTGSLWKASTRGALFQPPAWIRVDLVTASEQRNEQRRYWAWFANVMAAAIAAVLVMVLSLPVPAFLAATLVVLAYAGVAIVMLLRSFHELRRQVVIGG